MCIFVYVCILQVQVCVCVHVRVYGTRLPPWSTLSWLLAEPGEFGWFGFGMQLIRRGLDCDAGLRSETTDLHSTAHHQYSVLIAWDGISPHVLSPPSV